MKDYLKRINIVPAIVAVGVVCSICMAGIASGEEKKIPLLVAYQDNEGRYVVETEKQLYQCSEIQILSKNERERDIIFMDAEGAVLKTEHMNPGKYSLEISLQTTYIAISGEREEENSLQIDGILSQEGMKDKKEKVFNTGWKGKNVAIIGDSLTAFENYIPEGFYYHYHSNSGVELTDMWWYRLAQRFGMNICRVNACAGAGVTDLPWLYNKDMTHKEEAGKALHSMGREPDRIIIWLGGNDVLRNYERSQIVENYRNMVNDIQSRYPKAELYFCTYYLMEPAEGMQWLNEEIRRLAAEYQGHIIELETSGISAKNQEFYLMDGTHLNKKGMELITAWMTEELLETEK